MKITITVPENTDDAYFKSICDGFKKKYGEDTVFSKELSGELIGGFKAEADGEVYDTSIFTKLAAIKRLLTK